MLVSRSRLTGIILTATMVVALGVTSGARAATSSATDYSPTPDLKCGTGDRPETTQGRVPAKDYASGRAAKGYSCNAAQVSHVGASGGYRVYRYTDKAGHVCAFYDTTLLFPANTLTAPAGQTGVWVLDMANPAKPVHTATLSTPAMQSPHESFSINVKRGLLGAVFGYPTFQPGQFDLYDINADCRQPVLKATLPMAVLGHEGSFTPDGNTYYASSLYGHTLTAIDVTNTSVPTILWSSPEWNVHGMNLSDDGKTMYFADLGNSNGPFPGAGTDGTKGLTVLDVSQIQARAMNPQVRVVSHLTWPIVSTPQTLLPVTISGHRYLIEVDEFASGDNVGAARIIDIANVKAPKVISNMRLAVNSAAARHTDQQSDPGASSGLQGYAAHYCGVPSKVNPGIVACSFIVSGLRVFDIRDPYHPKEIAYFNRPSTSAGVSGGPGGAYAMSQPAFDPARGQIWYSDGNSGLYTVHLTHGVWPFTT